MFDLRHLEENFDQYLNAWGRRNQPELMKIVSHLKDDLQKRRQLIRQKEELLAQRNEATKVIAQKKKAGEDATQEIASQKGLGDRIKAAESEADELQIRLDQILLTIPNLPHDSVPSGTSAEQNQEVHRWGEIPSFSFEPLSHDLLGEKRGWLHFEKATTITGSRFSVSTGFAATLERVLIQFMLDVHTREHGYTEVLPPFIVNGKTLIGTGQLPKFKEDLFQLAGLDYFLIPTSEVPLTALHLGEILKPEELTKSYTAYSPCFRSEAGSYGKDLKGLIRQHQFNKVELVKICASSQSDAEHEKMRRDAERILELLELPYRTVLLCSGDMGFQSQKTYDIEVWLPSQKTYREISSVSNCGSFQARRLHTRVKGNDGKIDYVHTLNGSGLAVGRTLIAILENYQTADGKVRIPKVLRPYFAHLGEFA